MIRVTVEREDRLAAIRDMSSAIKSLASALNNQVMVNVSDCVINSVDTGIQIDTTEDHMRTEILDEPNQ